LINYNQILQSDYRGYLINVNLEQYFNMNHFDINKINSSQLNSRRLTHEKVFYEKVEEYIQATNLEQMIKDYCNTNSLDEILEILD